MHIYQLYVFDKFSCLQQNKSYRLKIIILNLKKIDCEYGVHSLKHVLNLQTRQVGRQTIFATHNRRESNVSTSTIIHLSMRKSGMKAPHLPCPSILKVKGRHLGELVIERGTRVGVGRM